MDKLLEHVDDLIAYIKEGEALARTEIPLFIQEYIRFEFWWRMLGTLIFLGLAVVFALGARHFFHKAWNWRMVNWDVHRNRGDWHLAYGWLGGLMCPLVLFCGGRGIMDLYWFMRVALAPRVHILDGLIALRHAISG